MRVRECHAPAQVQKRERTGVRARARVRDRGVRVRGLPAAAAAGAEARQAPSAFRSQKDLPTQGFGVSGLSQTLKAQFRVAKSGREMEEREGGREGGMERLRRKCLHAPARWAPFLPVVEHSFVG